MKPRIILYMIGHAPDAKYLPRLFESVKGLIDGVAFVATDEKIFTQEIEKDLDCDFEITRLLFADRESFDFSAARNKALELARTMEPDLCMWLDCDDVVNDSQGILAAINAHPDANGYGLMYDVGQSCDNLFKIRLHKPNDFEWEGKVHEELLPVVEKPEIKIFRDCVVTHSPDEGKSNHEFHISLLKKQCEGAPNHYAYIAKEYFNLRRFEDAIPWLEKTLAVHPFEIEQYNALLSLGICYANLEKEEEAEKAWQKAIHICPQRREAYYYLAEVYGLRGGEWLKRGLAHAACCNAQIDEKMPSQHKSIYRLNGYKLHARYLQRAGHLQAASQVMAKIKNEDLDEEAKQIILEIEGGLKEQAIENLTTAR